MKGITKLNELETLKLEFSTDPLKDLLQDYTRVHKTLQKISVACRRLLHSHFLKLFHQQTLLSNIRFDTSSELDDSVKLEQSEKENRDEKILDIQEGECHWVFLALFHRGKENLTSLICKWLKGF